MSLDPYLTLYEKLTHKDQRTKLKRDQMDQRTKL